MCSWILHQGNEAAYWLVSTEIWVSGREESTVGACNSSCANGLWAGRTGIIVGSFANLANRGALTAPEQVFQGHVIDDVCGTGYLIWH